MIPVAKLFLLDEGILDWMKNSISNVLGRRQLNKAARPAVTATEKVGKVRAAQENIPLPAPKVPVKMGMEGIKSNKVFTK